MPLYFGAYLADTMHLTTEQHGAYLLMLMASWMRGGNLPDDDKQLAAVVRLQLPKWKLARPVIAPFFNIKGGSWTQKRLNKELDAARGRAKVAADNGSRGGRPTKPKDNPDDNPEETQGRTQTKPITNPDHNPQESSLPLPLPIALPLPEPKTKANGAKPAADAAFELPDWVPKEQWDAWIEARKKKRNAPTTFAMRLAVSRLEQWREDGQSPAKILAEAAFGGWTGLHPLKL